MKDIFKKKNIKEATYWDWNFTKYIKRHKGDTQKLHKLSKKRLKQELKRGGKDE